MIDFVADPSLAWQVSDAFLEDDKDSYAFYGVVMFGDLGLECYKRAGSEVSTDTKCPAAEL